MSFLPINHYHSSGRRLMRVHIHIRHFSSLRSAQTDLIKGLTVMCRLNATYERYESQTKLLTFKAEIALMSNESKHSHRSGWAMTKPCKCFSSRISFGIRLLINYVQITELHKMFATYSKSTLWMLLRLGLSFWSLLLEPGAMKAGELIIRKIIN